MDATLDQLADRAGACVEGRTVAVAESFTAGLLSQSLATAEGASEWFCGGVVAYQVRTKRSVLDVTADDVVTEAAAVQMAEGVARLMGAEVGVATTGVAGPDDQDGVPAGTAVIGWTVGGRSGAHALHLDGDPEQVVHAGARAALECLCELLEGSGDQPSGSGSGATTGELLHRLPLQ